MDESVLKSAKETQGRKLLGNPVNLKSMIWFFFTITALGTVVLMGYFLSNSFSSILRNSIDDENESLIDQVDNSCLSYLRLMMKVSEALNYSVIKNMDLAFDNVTPEFQLLYDTNIDNIHSIALFSMDGDLIAAAPALNMKENVDVTKEDWFTTAIERSENMHFLDPVVEHWFVEDEDTYDWVIPLSRVVQITRNNNTETAVLLINLLYPPFADVFSQVSLGNNGYVYVITQDGQIIYHPQMQMINSGLIEENNLQVASYRDGSYEEENDGKKQTVTVKSVGYTGWKIIGITPASEVTAFSLKTNLFFTFLFMVFLFVIVLINLSISSMVSNPIQKLEDSVKRLEAGDMETPVYAEGFYEVRHLGTAIQNMANHNVKLMADIVDEHREKRKTELNALQSQINPHFLYNTLDIIVWMIENEKPAEAVRAVTALARFFRISLSRGKVIITVADELEHARNYLMIQEMRYKNKFHYDIECEDGVEDYGTIKLIVQPMVENSIYHAMEFMDGDGEIKVRAFVENSDLYFTISDNGSGMSEETLQELKAGTISQTGEGSGVGITNVQERIQLYYGKNYGLDIKSEPDVGTVVTLKMPAISYEEQKRNGLE